MPFLDFAIALHVVDKLPPAALRDELVDLTVEPLVFVPKVAHAHEEDLIVAQEDGLNET